MDVGGLDRRPESLRDLQRFLRPDSRHRDDELVASVPCRQVSPPDGAAHERCRLSQHLVSGGVPELVVELLEVIDVTEED